MVEPNQKLNVLLVEDDVESAHLVATAVAMGSVPFELHYARDGEEATDFLFRKKKFLGAPRPHFVILDLNLPKKNGRAVLTDIRADQTLRKIPVVVMSTTEIHHDICAEFNLRKECCYTKPDQFRELIELMKRLEKLYNAGQLNPRAKVHTGTILNTIYRAHGLHFTAYQSTQEEICLGGKRVSWMSEQSS